LPVSNRRRADSFRGSLAAPDVCARSRGLMQAAADIEVVARPMAMAAKVRSMPPTAVGSAGHRHRYSIGWAGRSMRPCILACWKTTAVLEAAQVGHH
jgi:hypothetical protein